MVRPRELDGRVSSAGPPPTADPPPTAGGLDAEDPAAVLSWLGSPAGAHLLAVAADLTASLTPLAAADRLRRQEPSSPLSVLTAALAQADLRARAALRFGDDAARMLFTRDGLEQATRRSVADHRARSLLHRGAGDVRTVADLCCGLGGDLVALARAGLAVTGVDADPVVLAVARANLDALSLRADLVRADVTEVDLEGFDAVVTDPARRSGRGRETSPSSFSPDWSWVHGLLTRPGARVCVTTTPALPHRMVPAGCEAEWVADGSDVLEAALWSGALTSGVRRRATLLGPDRLGPGSSATVTDADLPADPPPVRDPRLGDVLVEPHGAVVRAGLVAVVAARVDGALPAPGIAYVLARPDPSADAVADVVGRLGVAFTVEEVLPMRDRPVRARLAELGVGRLEILKRGVDVRPEAMRLRLMGARPSGTASATLVLTRTSTGAAAVLVSRIRPPASRG